MWHARLRRLAAGAVAAVCLLFGVFAAPPHASADTLSDLQKQFDTLQKQQKQLQSTASAQQSAAQAGQSQVQSLNTQIEVAQQQLDVLAKQIDEANARIQSQQEAISAAQQQVAQNTDLLKQRLRALYMSGNESYLETLLSSDNVGDFLTRSQVLQAVYQHDQRIVNELKQQTQRLQAEQDALKKTQQQLVTAQKNQQDTQAALSAQKTRQAAMVQNALSAAQQAQQQATAVGAQAQQTQKKISAEYAARAAAARAARAVATTVWDGTVHVGGSPLSAAVLAYRPTVETVAAKYGNMKDYVNLILAVMMQESSGLGNDPMQSLTGEDDPISNPALSIDVGIQELQQSLQAAGCQSPQDLAGIELGLQGYNYGVGYIPYAKQNGGGYSYTSAQNFSALKKTELGWKIYGDPQYVPHVLRYYSMP